jgi:hypothetical protein
MGQTFASKEEHKQFLEWKRLQDTTKKSSTHEASEAKFVRNAVDPSSIQSGGLLQTALVATTVAAATPFVLLGPIYGLINVGEGAVLFFQSNGVETGTSPLYLHFASLALPAHPAITFTCALSCAATFAVSGTFLRAGAWNGSSLLMHNEAARLGRVVGLGSALASPLLISFLHDWLIRNTHALDLEMPPSLAVTYWIDGGALGSFTFFFAAYTIGA